MLEFTSRVNNKIGMHLRAAGEFVKLANQFSSEVTVIMQDRKANGKSILGLASLELGRLCAATRRPDPAREYLSRAADLFELCGATILLEQARGELASLDPGTGHSPAGEVVQKG